MDLKRDKYDIEFLYDDAIKCHRIFLDFMQQTFNCLDRLYMHEKCLLIDAIKEDQFRKQSATEIERLDVVKKDRNKQK